MELHSSPRSLRSQWLLLSLLLSLHFISTRAHSLHRLISCIPDDVPLALPGTNNFLNLSTLNFRNNHRAPLAIVRARTERDVRHAVRCARRAQLTVCARAGGHSFTGNSMCEGVLVDVGALQKMKFVTRRRVSVGAGVTSGELVWYLWNAKRKWTGIGVCPGIGYTGFMLGGGHGPYEGRLSIACDSLVSLRMVDRRGRVVQASRRKNSELFWGTCGTGGGQFGVVTSYRMRVHSSRPFDRAVYFRFRWDRARAGEVLEKYMDYDQADGRVWVRMEMSLEKDEPGLHACGSCYNVRNVAQCMRLLESASFFGVESRETLRLVKAESALEVQAFFGPAGNWCRDAVPAEQLETALTAHKYAERGFGNDRLYTSALIKKSMQASPPSASFWQTYADFCLDPALPSLPWVVCHLNLFNNAVDTPRNNAFAHRDADLITLYFVGGGTEEDKEAATTWIRNHFKDYTSGIYVNFPIEPEPDYPQLYWGANLGRLSELKLEYDPDGLFSHPQPIPIGL